jgi:hypothetical protein
MAYPIERVKDLGRRLVDHTEDGAPFVCQLSEQLDNFNPVGQREHTDCPINYGRERERESERERGESERARE